MKLKVKPPTKTNADLMAEVIKTPGINPLMVLLRELNEQFDYGDNSKTVRTINVLLNHWFDAAYKDKSISRCDASNTLLHITKLTAFLTSLQESFCELKNSHPGLEKALTR